MRRMKFSRVDNRWTIVHEALPKSRHLWLSERHAIREFARADYGSLLPPANEANAYQKRQNATMKKGGGRSQEKTKEKTLTWKAADCCGVQIAWDVVGLLLVSTKTGDVKGEWPHTAAATAAVKLLVAMFCPISDTQTVGRERGGRFARFRRGGLVLVDGASISFLQVRHS